MFIEERHKKILEMLQKNKSITNQEIQDMFGISYDSAKRDLRLLEEQGMLKRTHGGAILRETIGAQYNIGDLTAKERIAKVDPNYLAIAKKAVTCINDNDVIFITGASVGYLMTQNLPHDLNCTIVTNSISIADNLRQYPNITILLLGGQFHKNGCALIKFLSPQQESVLTSDYPSSEPEIYVCITLFLRLQKKFMDFTLPAKLAQILL